MKKIICALLFLALAGCATTGQQEDRSTNTLLVVGGIVAVSALAIAISSDSGDDGRNDKACGGPTPAAHCIDTN